MKLLSSEERETQHAEIPQESAKRPILAADNQSRPIPDPGLVCSSVDHQRWSNAAATLRFNV